MRSTAEALVEKGGAVAAAPAAAVGPGRGGGGGGGRTRGAPGHLIQERVVETELQVQFWQITRGIRIADDPRGRAEVSFRCSLSGSIRLLGVCVGIRHFFSDL